MVSNEAQQLGVLWPAIVPDVRQVHIPLVCKSLYGLATWHNHLFERVSVIRAISIVERAVLLARTANADSEYETLQKVAPVKNTKFAHNAH